MKTLKINPAETGFDIDGVVADTMASFINIAKQDYGIHNIVKEQITSYWLEECLPIPDEIIEKIIARILTDPFGTGLKPNPGAVETLTAVGQEHTLVFVTARPVREPICRWLEQTLSEVQPERINVIATGEHSAKVSVLKKLGIKYFVEDHLATCLEIHQAGINAIVFDQPWNRNDPDSLWRVKGWKELGGLMKGA